MRKIVLALAAVAAVGLAVPVVSVPAEAHASKRVVVIKKKTHWNRGHHYGWTKNRHHRGGHGAAVIVR